MSRVLTQTRQGLVAMETITNKQLQVLQPYIWMLTPGLVLRWYPCVPAGFPVIYRLLLGQPRHDF